MNIEQAVFKYIASRIKTISRDYQWKLSINLSKFPLKCDGFDGSEYDANIALREFIYKKIKSKDLKSKELQEWYVKDWGGIRGNKQETMDEYVENKPEMLIAKGSEGIASWSKMLCIRNPGEYAIFDSRVAFSLNAIQKKYKIKDKYLFPHLAGRREAIKVAHKALMNEPEFAQLKRNADFYERYIQILKYCAAQANSDIQTVEMVLFHHATDLAKQ